ncbi:carboxylesterase [Neiella sp. HB171785]|uniref:Carboxylesterase n=1 Tax=Neiella litorisoli TaxID=2771431 RepID=A0A8J6UQ92_9GAMM|nr:alpha/beta fold hydrolase [Neiella litorisoli]MBD1390602.1 carboxylesterase [Neiella litorisoli]
MELNCVVRQTADDFDAVVIWLHGLGASGDDFVPALPYLELPASAKIRFVFPNAPRIPVTINAGYVMPAWYDIISMGEQREFNVPQLLASADMLKQLIDLHVEAGIDSRRIIIAGFSQGGAVAYQTVLNYPKPLAGLLALSTYFPTAERAILGSANQAIDIALHHGHHDEVVTPPMAKAALNDLVRLGAKVNTHFYPMRHEVCLPQLKDIGAFISRQLML